MTKHRLDKFRIELQAYEAAWNDQLNKDSTAHGPALDTISAYKEFEPRPTGKHPLAVYPWMLLRPIDPISYADVAASLLLEVEAQEAGADDDVEKESVEQHEELPSSRPP